jgi:hypothetical protein
MLIHLILSDSDNLPAPEVIAEDLEVAPAQFREIATDIGISEMGEQA